MLLMCVILLAQAQSARFVSFSAVPGSMGWFWIVVLSKRVWMWPLEPALPRSTDSGLNPDIQLLNHTPRG